MAIIIDEVLEYIENHPNTTSREIIDALSYKRSTVTARITQLRYRGSIEVSGEKYKDGRLYRKYRATGFAVRTPKHVRYLKIDSKILNILSTVDTWDDERLTSLMVQDEERSHMMRYVGDGYEFLLYRYKSYPKLRLQLNYHSCGINIDMIGNVRSFPSHQTYRISNQHTSIEVRSK